MSEEMLGELSYDAAIRALDLQERGVEQLRARTGTLLAASSLTASFLGAQAIQRSGGIGLVGILALVSLACSIVLGIFVMLPRRGFVFGLSAQGMYESLLAVADDGPEIQRRLVYWMEVFWEANQARIEKLDRYYFAAALTLILQLAFWSWALVASVS